ncbi:MAG: sigma-70 family RNA polymerase sigma factor [Actinobacteria bacterium]|nr:sigma-70 family RNA polymerase sigma factor [Actinomycetota bacterium]
MFEPLVPVGRGRDVRDATVISQGAASRTSDRIDVGHLPGRIGHDPGTRRCRRKVLTPADISAMIDEYQRTGDRRIRNLVVESRLDVADHQVSRFSHSVGVSADDLRQTALLAMIRAVDRFDSSLGVTFRTFASRTIEGELKRYLRDRTWAVRPPRQAQELHLRVRRSCEELGQQLGRAPTMREIATELATEVDRVRDALQAGQARSAAAFDASGVDGEESPTIAKALGRSEAGFARIEQQSVLRGAVGALDERQRLVLHLRYVDELTQPEIAEAVGLSQSYVSRLLRGSLEQLRAELAA